MTDGEPGREADEFYVPTPEELEQGLEASPRRRRGVRTRGDRRRGESRSVWARRLFQLRPGVGQKRTEAPAPTPIPPRVDSPPAVSRTEPDPPLDPSSRSSLPRPSKSLEGLTKAPESVSRRPVKGGKSSSSASSRQRLRRVAVPKRKAPSPLEKPVRSPVPDYVMAKAERLGHRLGEFQERRTGSSEYQRTFVSECGNCGSKAYARNVADENYALKWDSSTWRDQGPSFESHCSGGTER